MNGTKTIKTIKTTKDNITIRDQIKIMHCPILICPSCKRKYIKTEENQKECLFCIKGFKDLRTYKYSFDL